MVQADPPYEVELRRPAEKALKRLPAQARAPVYDALEALEQDPRPRGCKTLEPHTYRIRINTSASSYRVMYVVHDAERVVEVLAIQDRKVAYTKKGRQAWRGR